MTPDEAAVERRRWTVSENIDIQSDGSLGALFAFVTEGEEMDAHTPIMMERYEQLAEFFDGRVPLYFINVNTEDHNEIGEKFLVWSVPTLIWRIGRVTVMRLVGTVNYHKLEAEADKVIEDKILNEA
jgi:hypothetical protein